MKELVLDIAKSLVDHPEDVVVEENISDGQVNITIKVAEADIGQIIGKQGRIANSIRTITKATGTKQNQKVFVEILD